MSAVPPQPRGSRGGLVVEDGGGGTVNSAAVPITVLGELTVVGPAAGPASRHSALVERAAHWSALRPTAACSPGVPVAVVAGDDALRRAAGTVAATGPQAAAVIHPDEPDLSRLCIPGTGRNRWSAIRTLADVGAPTTMSDGVSAEAVETLTAAWSGLFVPDPSRTVPVGDMSVARLHVLGVPAEPVLGWAARPELAWGHAVLAGARRLSTRSAPPVPAGRAWVGASGVSELHWLLDGALRLLSGYAAGPLDRGVDDPFEVAAYRVPYLASDWLLARAFDAATGAPVAAAWGRGVSDAMRHAVTAARVLSATHPAVGYDPGAPTADELLTGLSPADLAGLQRDVQRCLGRMGFRPLGVRLVADALLGDPGVTWGRVWRA